MNEAGVLGRFIPDFGRVVGHDAVLDVSPLHGRRASAAHRRRAEPDRGGRLKEEHPLVSELLPHIAQPHGALCRGVPARHRQGPPRGPFDRRRAKSRAGSARASACRRPTRDRVAWLVEQHLTMSNMAQGRDLSDPRTAETLRRDGAVARAAAHAAGADRRRHPRGRSRRVERLEGPAAAHALFWETEVVLGGGHSAIDRKARVAAAQDGVAQGAARLVGPRLRRLCAASLSGLLAQGRSAAPGRPRQAALRDGGGGAVAGDRSRRAIAYRGVTEITVVAPDHPRLLSIVAGACAAAGGNIVDAQIFTTTDGFALDTISVSRAFERDEDEMRRGRPHGPHDRAGAARRDQGQRAGQAGATAAATRAPAPSRIEPEVTIDNAMSQPLHGAGGRPGSTGPACSTS